MRIGVAPASMRSAGGAFQYSLTFLDLLGGIHAGDRFVVFHEPATDLPLGRLRSGSFETVATALLHHRSVVRGALAWAAHGVDRVLGGGLPARAWRAARRSVSRSLMPAEWDEDPDTIRRRTPLWRALFDRHRVERMIYLGPTECAFEAGIPYAMVVHDLLHRFHPEFPEASVHGPSAYYEYAHRHGVRHATAIVVDSATGKEDVVAEYGRYGLTPDRVAVLPLLPPPYLREAAPAADVRTRYRLPERYLFYPARFWAHKNHARLFEALRLLKDRDRLEIPLVLVGFDSSDPPQRGEIALRDMRALSDRLGLELQIRYAGLAADGDMAGLYAAAEALVMPTLLGPSNIPVLEAWQLGCPVITSDMRGTRDQAGDAALLVDPCSVEAIAAGIRRVWMDGALRRALIQRGAERLLAQPREDSVAGLAGILDELKRRPKWLRP